MAKKTVDGEFVTRKEFNERMDIIEKKLSNTATKDDLKRFATKDDFARLLIEILKNRQDIEKIKEVMATKDDIRLILSTIDNFVKRTHDCENKSMLNPTG